MKLSAALLIAPLVCALSGSAFAEGDHKACLEGDKKVCIEIGTAIAKDELPAADVAELRSDCEKTKDDESCAAWLFEEVKAGCRSGNKPAACRTLGESEARRIAEETAPTPEELEASCKKKDNQACVDLATNLLRQHPSKADAKRALGLLDKSCKADFGDACAKLGLILVFDGKKADAKRGDKLLRRACDLGSKAGCNWVPPQPKALKPDENSTGQGILGTLRATEDVGQTMKNMVKLDKLLHQNCKLGYADACAEIEAAVDEDPANRKISTSAEIAAKIRKLERQAAAGPAKK